MREKKKKKRNKKRRLKILPHQIYDILEGFSFLSDFRSFENQTWFFLKGSLSFFFSTN